ncbi:transketolase [Anaerovibrio lipolyticus]|uniref:transketolase n=1 Tax=Anaerovibrio lipolyticus TaxID=82374 RepID=UPI0023F3048C|nr:transketolase [Anaerovibrio lipolyticus]
MSNVEKNSVNAIRILAAEMIQKAKSGHPGLPMGCAPIAYELWGKHMNHNGKNPKWANRDRFILSGGHGSAMLYSLLHLFGYGLTIDDLKNFRQLDSLTPGHPEYAHTVGVEATTGPLGAGMAMAVGMAMAERHLAAEFNKPGYEVVDHYTFVLGGDGCLMEGISSEAFSLAGTLGLSKLIVIYDSNRISIEGSTDIAFTEDVMKRMEAFGFQTIDVADGTDCAAIGAAIEKAKADTTRPSFIRVHTEIGYGCPAKQGTASAHGEPLGEENLQAAKENLQWPEQEAFKVPEEVYADYKELASRGEKAEAEWNKLFAAYCANFPEEAKRWEEFHAPVDAEALLNNKEFWARNDKPTASRALSGNLINKLNGILPNMFGGSADLAPSNKTEMKGESFFAKDNYAGKNIHFGVRELAMSAIANGITLHGGLRTFVGTFFVFSDYLKPMIRLAAIMGLPVTYVLTHDSIGVGEDGPTHEPIEQLAMLRSLPNINVFRPADDMETAAAWYSAVTSTKTPTALVLTRQNLAPLAGSSKEALKGAYVVSDSSKEIPDGIIIATGSEVALGIEAQEILKDEGVDVRVVSMPCMDIFEEQSQEYKDKILPKNVRARVAVEAGKDFGWGKYIGLDGATVCMTSFGASAPAAQLFEKFGFNKENVAEAMRKVIAGLK